jgi:hypothetical protein
MAKKMIAAPVGAGTGGAVDAVKGRARLTGRLLVRVDAKAELSTVMKGLDAVVLPRLRIAVVEDCGGGGLQWWGIAVVEEGAATTSISSFLSFGRVGLHVEGKPWLLLPS